MDQVGNFGLSVNVVATKTFPIGFSITKFADDISPIEFGETQVADHEYLVDGSIFGYETAAGISVKIAVIPGSDEDQNLAVLMAANKSEFRIGGMPEIMAISIMYPNQPPIILSNGYIRTGKVGTDVAETGRSRGKVYEFIFQNNTQISIRGLISSGLQVLGNLPPLF